MVQVRLSRGSRSDTGRQKHLMQELRFVCLCPHLAQGLQATQDGLAWTSFSLCILGYPTDTLAPDHTLPCSHTCTCTVTDEQAKVAGRLVPSGWFWMICHTTCCANSTELALCCRFLRPSPQVCVCAPNPKVQLSPVFRMRSATLADKVVPSMAMPIASQNEACSCFADVLKGRISSSSVVAVVCSLLHGGAWL